MINYYQPFLLPFLRFRSYRLPTGLRRTYFVSFEDALWVLLRRRNIPKHSVILIPDFYCIDVVNNIRNHGYKPVFYPLDDNFQITRQNLTRFMSQYAPRIVILFHACGIQNDIAVSPVWMFETFPGLLVIEDAVQRLVDPAGITLSHPNHYCIDSLRKVSPLPGSFLYYLDTQPNMSPDPIRKEWRYYVTSIFHFYLFRLIYLTGVILRSSALITYAHEKTLKNHDDIIGDSIGGYAGYPFVHRLHSHINFKRVRSLKERQVTLYQRLLHPVVQKHTLWYEIAIPEESKGEMHVFPIGIKHKKAEALFSSIEAKLHKKGIIVWFKFPDAPWSNNRGVLFLPLGFHIKRNDIEYTVKTLDATLTRLGV